MSQYLRPTSDISNNGWTYSTGTTAYVLLDETSPSDTDYMAVGSTTNGLRVGLSGATQPYASGVGTLSVRAKQTSSTNSLDIFLEDSSANAVGSMLTPTLTASFATYTFEISETNLAKVARMQLSGKNCQVSWVQIETPDVAVTAGLEMGMMF